MKKHVLLASILMALSAPSYAHQISAEKLIIFGDSLSDNGNILRFTYNQENIYNEHLANYFGYHSPRHDGNFVFKNQDGPNYALGGAVANHHLGGFRGWISPKLSDEVSNYLKSKRNVKDSDYKYILWIGGNDLRLANDDINLGSANISADQSQHPKVRGSVQAVEKELRRLLIDAKAKFIIVPNAPNIAVTPRFTNNFISEASIYFDGRKTLLGGRRFLGFGSIDKDEVIRFLDDQNNQGRPVREVIYSAFEYILRKQYKLAPNQPLSSMAFQELQQWKHQFERAYRAQTSIVQTFNQGVDQVIANFKKNPEFKDVVFLRPDIQSLLNDVMTHYTEFGFNNVSGSAAHSFTSSVIGGAAGSGRVAAFEPEDGKRGAKDKSYLWGKGYRYIYADQFHPSPKVHRMISDYIMSLIESESGDPTDFTVKRVSTTPFYSTSNKIYHSAEGDGVFHVDNTKEHITRSNLTIKNDGRALFASHGGQIDLTRVNITSQGRLGGIINAESGAKITLTDGQIDIYRTNPYVAPFGVAVNGEGSTVELNKIRLNTYGKETTAITVGNQANITLKDTQVRTQGVGANVLNLWNSSATLQNATLRTDSDLASAIRVFANDSVYRLVSLRAKNSMISGKHYAIKVAKNLTQASPVLNAYFNASVVDGGIYTDEKSFSYFVFDKSQWNMTKDSSVTDLNLRRSALTLSQNQRDWQAKHLVVKGDLVAQNAKITMGVDLGNDLSQTDRITVKGDSFINALLRIEKRLTSRGAQTQAGIKLIDLDPARSHSGYLSLANEVRAGLYQYVLSHGGLGADDQTDYYLTSSYVKHNGQVLPVVRLSESTAEDVLVASDETSEDMNSSSAPKARTRRSIADLTTATTASTPASSTSATATPVKRILNTDATLLSSIPYLSSYMSQLQLAYAQRTPNTAIWNDTGRLDYWANLAYAYDDTQGDEFLKLKQHSQILAMGRDFRAQDRLAGVSVSYARTQSSVDNAIKEALDVGAYAGSVTSNLLSLNGYFAQKWQNWHAQIVLAVGMLNHHFKNKDNVRYTQNGYVLSSEQMVGYRYVLNQDWTLQADLGLQEEHHSYGKFTLEDVNVAAISAKNINGFFNLGATYQVDDRWVLSANLKFINNFSDFDHLVMNDEKIVDKFAKDRMMFSAHTQYAITEQVSAFANLAYWHNLHASKLNKLNAQLGLNIQF